MRGKRVTAYGVFLTSLTKQKARDLAFSTQEVINLELIEKLNKFTRREFNEDEVYIFSVILCDNETDRDNEKFSLSALSEMKSLFN